MWGETEGLMLLFRSVLFVSRRKVRWEGGKGGRVVRRDDERYLVLFKGWGHRMSPRFHLFVSDVNQENEGTRWVQDFLAWPQRRKDSP